MDFSASVSKKRWLSLFWGVLAALFTGGAVALSFMAPSMGVLVARPAGDPRETVIGFFDALTAGDYAQAYSYLRVAPELGLAPETDDEGGRLLADALHRSYGYTLNGECAVDKLSAVQRVTFTYLDLPAAQTAAADRVEAVLAGFVDARPSSQIYDSDRNYLPQVAREAYDTAVAEALADPGAYAAAAELELALEYVGGRWALIPNGELFGALMGGVPESVTQLDIWLNNAASDALRDLTYIPKHYTVAESALSAPLPDADRFGSTDDPAEVMAVIASAAELMEGQETAFDPEAPFAPKKPIQYYYDETILVIAWQQIIGGRCVSFAEVKIADGSQIRRKLAGDTYGSSVRYYASDMARDANAVAAINGDFYEFRSKGITVYQRQVYRCNSPTLDTCFFTASGDMLLSYAGEHTDWDETQQFVDDNDVIFATTFGPILVDNGELCTVPYDYPLGEVYATFSRSVLGMLGERHYLLMTVNFEPGYISAGTVTVQQAGRIMYDMGCEKAYCMDGGQTAILYFNGRMVNNVDFGYERTMSDIICFVTALPEEEALR